MPKTAVLACCRDEAAVAAHILIKVCSRGLSRCGGGVRKPGRRVPPQVLSAVCIALGVESIKTFSLSLRQPHTLVPARRRRGTEAAAGADDGYRHGVERFLYIPQALSSSLKPYDYPCMRADAAAKAAAAAAGADEGNERFLKRFLQYARSHCFPRLTPEAAQQLQAEYVSIRQQVRSLETVLLVLRCLVSCLPWPTLEAAQQLQARDACPSGSTRVPCRLVLLVCVHVETDNPPSVAAAACEAGFTLSRCRHGM